MSKEVKRFTIGTFHAAIVSAGSECVLASDYDALLEENKQLRGLYKMHQETETREMRDLRAERDALLAERDALAKDAERYRWLRDEGFAHADVSLGTDCDGDNFVSYRISFHLPEAAHSKFEDDEWSSADVDAAIDAALQGAQP